MLALCSTGKRLPPRLRDDRLARLASAATEGRPTLARAGQGEVLARRVLDSLQRRANVKTRTGSPWR
jgi:hypothetical protein